MGELEYIDCSWKKCKNLQKFKTIEMFFYITTDDGFAIEYNFHPIDLEIWKEIVKVHKEECEVSEIYDQDGDVVNEEDLPKRDYYVVKLKSKDFNLYRNINILFFINENKDSLEEIIEKNTWNS